MNGLYVVFLTYIYKETGVTLLCTVTVFFLAFLAFNIIAGNLLQFRRILIIAHKTAELTGHDTLYDIVLVHPVQAAENLGQELFNLLLIDLNALKVINNLIKLFLANLGTGGHHTLHESLADGLLNKAYLTLLTQVHDGY